MRNARRANCHENRGSRVLAILVLLSCPAACSPRCRRAESAEAQAPSRQRAMGDASSSTDAFKAVAALALLSMGIVGGLLPLWLQDVASQILSGLNTAAGGVFFASAMVRALRRRKTRPRCTTG